MLYGYTVISLVAGSVYLLLYLTAERNTNFIVGLVVWVLSYVVISFGFVALVALQREKRLSLRYQLRIYLDKLERVGGAASQTLYDIELSLARRLALDIVLGDADAAYHYAREIYDSSKRAQLWPISPTSQRERADSDIFSNGPYSHP
jgi:hypothetical protein